MKKFTGLIAAAAVFTLAGTAGAETWYAGAYGGLNYAHDGDVNGAGTNATYDLGFAVGGYAGLYVNKNIRLEGELAYRSNDIDTIGGIGVGGEVASLAIMINALYEFDTTSGFRPHVGGGLGFADADYTLGALEYGDTVLAAQLIAGVGIEIAPALDLTVDYRLFFTDDLGIGGGAGLGAVEYTNSTFLVGLRKSF